jgi:hypothetical protein
MKPFTTPEARVADVVSASGARETANRLGGMRLLLAQLLDKRQFAFCSLKLARGRLSRNGRFRSIFDGEDKA